MALWLPPRMLVLRRGRGSQLLPNEFHPFGEIQLARQLEDPLRSLHFWVQPTGRRPLEARFVQAPSEKWRCASSTLSNCLWQRAGLRWTPKECETGCVVQPPQRLQLSKVDLALALSLRPMLSGQSQSRAEHLSCLLRCNMMQHDIIPLSSIHLSISQ